MGHVLIQASDPAVRSRIERTPGLPFPVHWCDRAEDVSALALDYATLALVVDTHDQRGSPTAEPVRRIRDRRTDLAILLWCARAELNTPLFTDICRAGVSAVLFREASELELIILSQLVPRGTLTFHDWVEASVHRCVPSGLTEVVGFCLHRANASLTVPQVAEALRMPRRTLTDHLARAGLPTARELLEWGRVLTAAWDLEHSTRSAERIALETRFASPGVLRSILKRWTNQGPRDLRLPGGFGWVLRSLERTLVLGQQRAVPRIKGR